MKRCLILVLLLSVSTCALGQEQFSSIEERMTGKEFSETGLVKLTPEELAALNEWLRSHSVATLEDARYSPSTQSADGDMRGFKQKNSDDEQDIVSRIVGEFSGWERGGTLIKLENGMIWKTDPSDRFYIPPKEGAMATISSGFFGSWRLEVQGYNKSVTVERVR